MNTLAQIARSYGLRPRELSRFIGIEGVDPQSELNDGQIALVVRLIENSDNAGSSGRHHF